jgi:hypothetical protein
LTFREPEPGLHFLGTLAPLRTNLREAKSRASMPELQNIKQPERDTRENDADMYQS